MTVELILIVAAMTYASRAAVVLLPELPSSVGVILERIPPALFAGLAVHELLSPTTGLAEPQVLAAAAGALIAAPLRSLPVCLAAGIGAYLLWGVLT